MQNKTMTIGSAVVYKRGERGVPRGKRSVAWFLVKGKDGNWELPKSMARRGESSVRASIRMMAEEGGMRAKILEEAGRNSGVIRVNGKVLNQKMFYYLMVYKEGGEVLGFGEYIWLEYAKALRKLSNKRDLAALRNAKKILTEIEKDRKKKK